jgi:putative drug exporter of the RND superfamily
VAALLDRLGRAAARRKWITIAAWVIAAVVVAAVAVGAGGKTVDVFSIPGAQSQQATDLLNRRFPSRSGDTAAVVFVAQPGATLRDPQLAAAVAATQTRLGALAHVTEVAGPATPGVGGAFVSRDATVGYANVQYDTKATELPAAAFHQLEAAAAPARQAGLGVVYGGAVADVFNQQTTDSADAIGILVAVVILLVAFGSVIAMSIPIGTALFGLVVGLSLIFALAAVTDIGTVAPTLATMIGLGVGIDYSLFILTRHRQNLAAGMTVIDSIGLANGTAGQAVLFAGGTVVIAICGLALAGIPYVTWLGLTSAMVVLVMITAALTLIPALLAVAGTHLNRVRTPRLRRSARGPDHHALTGAQSHGWERWARFMSRHRWPAVFASLTVLLVLAAPVLGMRLGQVDDGSAPRSTTQRQAYDRISQGFGKGANGPLVLAVSFPTAGDTQAATVVETAVARVPGVAAVAPPQLSPTRDAAVVVVVPSSAPQSAATETLVDHLRTSVLPAALKGTGAAVYVGGVTASYIDLGQRIQDRLPLFIGAVVGVSFLLLMMVFRSVFVPLKAALMNLLSIGAAFGVIVAVFQWGWLKDVVGVSETTPIVAYVPMMMFAILFGLSMDYEVFLLSRIREDYHETKDNLDSVINGLSVTARVITSAALIMISVFLGFVASPEPTVKMFGLGLAVAVFVDATVVRLVLVPATMELLGDANWWLPDWLDRILPRIEIEGGAPPPPVAQPVATPDA